MNLITYIIDAVNAPQITIINATYKLILGLLLGCAIGFERKRKGQKAGVRTFALIALGSTLAMILSIYIPQEYMGLKNGDPGRIAAQVITGIGFLGAGAIIQMKGAVRGLTTAAGIWVSAAIGMSVGAGLYWVSFIATLCVLFVLSLLEDYEHKVNFGCSSKVIRIKLEGIVVSDDAYVELFERYGIHLTNEYMKFDYEENYTVANFLVLTSVRTDFAKLFSELSQLNKTLSITLTNEINL